MLFPTTLSREASHARHDRLEISLGPRYFFRTPDSDVPVHLPYTLQHLLDEPPQFRIGPAIVNRLGRRQWLVPRA